MNSAEREIRLKYRYSELSYVCDVYSECELRANYTQQNYEDLKPGEFKFDYKSWENRLGYSHRQMVRAIKELSLISLVIVQREKGKKGVQSRYFLTRFGEQKNEQKNEQNEGQNKHSNVNGLNSMHEQNEEQKKEQKMVQLSLHNNHKMKSINNYMSDSNEYKLAEYLYKHILENNPKAKEPNFQKWSKQFDYIIRIDKRNFEEVKELIKLSQKHTFWYKIILSPDNLRKHYDKLLLEKNYKNSKNALKIQEPKTKKLEDYI